MSQTELAPKLADLLRVLQAPNMDAREAVLAIGSNGSPGQLAIKYRDLPLPLPMTFATVRNLRAGVSAHVNRHGYLPATPITAPGATSRLIVLWPDAEQLEVLDRTEPNYRRVHLSPMDYPVTLEGGLTLNACFGYVSKHGCIGGPSGPWPLASQPELIMRVLDSIPRLNALCGHTPEEWVMATREEQVRQTIQAALRADELIIKQSEFFD